MSHPRVEVYDRQRRDAGDGDALRAVAHADWFGRPVRPRIDADERATELVAYLGALLELLLIIANIGTAVVIVPILKRQFEELSPRLHSAPRPRRVASR